MNIRRSRAARTAVSLTAMALLASSAATGALAQESPSPSPEATPEAVTTAETTEGTDNAPKAPLPLKDNTYALGQAMQIRVNADGEPNSSLLNFRWTVAQVTIQGPPDGSKDGSYDVPVPEGGDMVRYLDNFGKPSVENGVADWTVDVKQGAGTQRTVSLFPQDAEPKIALKTRFTLDGQEISAKDLVGKSGVVTAQYTLINQTTAPTEVTVKDLAGNDVTKTVSADVPMIAIGKTLLPQRYTGLNTGAGQFGSDGRGNNQVQFIALPFRPLSKDGTATFGWSANVTDAVIPSMLLQVAPLYLPAHEDDPATPEVDESQPAGLPVNLDPALAEIQAGLASVVAGVQTLTSGPDPLDTVESGLNNFFQTFGTTLQEVGVLLDPTNPDSALAAVDNANAALDPVIAKLTAFSGSIAPDVLQGLAEALSNPTVRGLLTNIANTDPGSALGAAKCAALESALGAANVQAECATLVALSAKIIAVDPDKINTIADLVSGGVPVLLSVLTVLDGVLQKLDTALTQLSSQIAAIGAGLSGKTVDLPPLDAVISQVVAGVLASPGGQQITGGLAQVKGGAGMAAAEIGAFAADAIAKVKGLAGDANTAIVDVKASLAGLVTAASTPPLIYGPVPEGTPPGTVLTGAYEFRIDAADTNLPYTPWRILLGVLALIGASVLAMFIAKRSAQAAPAAAQGTAT
jgi:flagellin-like hook-associated protein FlgL